MISVLMHTDFPEPVEPAINRWGILARSATMACPLISLPKATVNFDLLFWKASLSSTSRKPTIVVDLLGTSIPTAAFPGIGASMRTPATAILKAISSARLIILLTFTPAAGRNSYCVIAGPQLTFTIFPFTPKSFNVFSSCSTFCIMAAMVFLSPAFLFSSSKSMEGSRYPCSCRSSRNGDSAAATGADSFTIVSSRCAVVSAVLLACTASPFIGAAALAAVAASSRGMAVTFRGSSFSGFSSSPGSSGYSVKLSASVLSTSVSCTAFSSAAFS